MIYVERSIAADACSALDRLDKHGLSECDYALWYFGGVEPGVQPLPAKPTKAPKFGAYRKSAVKEALAEIFHNKCAYCESLYAHVTAMDVEHYRPKGGYLDDAGVLRKPGYYWLAAAWENLLPSCNDCNRERKQHRRAKDGKLVKSKSGKANKFPLAPGSPRADTAAELAAEVPLLLNPCSDQPERHLRFLSGGFVEPAETPDEGALPKGGVTIDVCGLDRHLLVGQRRELAIQVMGAMESVFTADHNVRRYPLDAEFTQQREAGEATLATYVDGAGQYRAMVQTLSAAFIHVRRAATAYFQAERAWTDAPSEATKAALTATIADILALRRSMDFDRELVVQLLCFARVPLPAA